MQRFPEHKGLDLSQINKDILERWTAENTFQQSLDARKGKPAFVFYEGPPSANGMPGIHHVMARAIKDIFCRYKTQKGYCVNRKAGWDTHGLPVELGVEKSLGITKEDIGKTVSVEEYNAACRRDVMKYTHEWEDLTRKMGYWVDMGNPYITYDNRYIETLWWLLRQLYEKGLLYKGYTIQPYSPAAGTGLSTHELNQPGCYRDVKDRTAVAMFKLTGSNLPMTEALPTYILAWTTTPWTLPSNTALCVGPNIAYNLVKTTNPHRAGETCILILATKRMSAYFGEKKIEQFEIVGEMMGRDLVGLEYEQLLPFVNPLHAEELQTPRLILRKWQENDAESLYKYAKNPNVGPIAGWPPHTSVENSREIIKNILSAPETYAVALKETGEAVGSIGLMMKANEQHSAKMAEGECELGYWIGQPLWGSGLMPEAVNEMLRHAFEDLNFTAAWCGYYDGNEQSKRVGEKCGFTYSHTEYNKPTLLNDVRTEHFTKLTRGNWEKITATVTAVQPELSDFTGKELARINAALREIAADGLNA